MAVTRDREVGVDVELVRRDFPFDEVADRFFTEREQRVMKRKLSPEMRADVFFATWTKKEAYLKGLGTGFGGTELGLEAMTHGRLDASKGGVGNDLDETPGWTLAAFDAGVGYAAAVAVEGSGVRIPNKARELSLSVVQLGNFVRLPSRQVSGSAARPPLGGRTEP